VFVCKRRRWIEIGVRGFTDRVMYPEMKEMIERSLKERETKEKKERLYFFPLTTLQLSTFNRLVNVV
jgi:hypothetical protein